MNMEIEQKIKKWGYTPFVVKTETANFYKLEDGTILKVLPILNAIKLDNKQRPESAGVSLQNVASIFCPPSVRGKPSTERISLEQAIKLENIEKTDIGFEVINEHFNEYLVDKKWRVSIKTTLSQVNKSKFRNNFGEPIYGINTTPITKFKEKHR